MGWLRLVGSLKIYVSFAEYSLFYRALLQKRPIILRSLLIVVTPYYDSNLWRLTRNMCVRVCVRACVRACTWVCVRECARTQVRGYGGGRRRWHSVTLPLDFVANKESSLSSWCVYREIDQAFRHGLLDDQSMSPAAQCMRTKHGGWALGLWGGYD